jgi:hypothetical protein
LGDAKTKPSQIPLAVRDANLSPQIAALERMAERTTESQALRQRSIKLQMARMMIAPTIAPINPALLSALYQPTAWPRIGGNEGADNSKDGRQNETGWLIGTGVNPFRNDVCNEADQDGPYLASAFDGDAGWPARHHWRKHKREI